MLRGEDGRRPSRTEPRGTDRHPFVEVTVAVPSSGIPAGEMAQTRGARSVPPCRFFGTFLAAEFPMSPGAPRQMARPNEAPLGLRVGGIGCGGVGGRLVCRAWREEEDACEEIIGDWACAWA